MVYCKKIECVIYVVVSCNVNMNDDNNWFDYIKHHPDKPWGYNCLSENPNITWDIVGWIKEKS